MGAAIRGLAVLLVIGGLLWSGPARAVKYMSLKKAIMTFLPEGCKVTKLTKKIKPELRSRFVNDYGWKPEKSKYSFYVGRDQAGRALAYVVIVPEIFGTCFHKYAVGMKPDGEVIDVAVVELSCPRATPINRRAFLKQFREKRHSDPLTIKSDVDAVTGATLSSETTARAARKAVSLHNLLLGEAQPVKLSEKVRAARAAGDARIDHAIKSGELVDPKNKKPGPVPKP